MALEEIAKEFTKKYEENDDFSTINLLHLLSYLYNFEVQPTLSPLTEDRSLAPELCLI